MLYPKTCVTELDRVEYCHIALEKLRFAHNAMGKRFRDGEISKAEWRQYVVQEYEPRVSTICVALNKAREGMWDKPKEIVGRAWAYDRDVFQKSERFAVDITAIEKSGTPLEVADPIEDFTAYTEVDPAPGYITRTSSTITFTDFDRDITAYVYRDKGAAHFAGDFEHLVDLQVSADEVAALIGCWSLQNDIADMRAVVDASGDELFVCWYQAAGVHYIYMEEIDGGTAYTDNYPTAALSTPYYLKVKRVEADGTYGTLYCYIYSNSDRTTLVDTLSIALHTSKKDYRYVYALNSYNTAQADRRGTGTVANLDLQETSIAAIAGVAIGSIEKVCGVAVSADIEAVAGVSNSSS